MPACFQLLRDGKPVPMAQVDDEMCAAFGVQPDAKLFLDGWYGCIGLMLANGKQWDEIRETFPELTRHANWLEANFKPNSWRE